MIEIRGEKDSITTLSGFRFIAGCALVALVILAIGRLVVMPLWLLAAEVFATVIGLFLFGSFRFRVHKNAVAYGMVLVVVATYAGIETTPWHADIEQHGWWWWTREHVLSFEGLDRLVHIDTMLFILGLTFFVGVVAQTRLLEGVTLALLKRNKGMILPTVVAMTAFVAIASGILDGVSMIGLTIRTLVIILMLAAAPPAAVRYAVMVCTAVTTICGIWLAYGEPPNLIMKANLEPALDNTFFLRYCLPAAVVSYAVVAWNLRRTLGRRHIDLSSLDILDANLADVRFLQAARHGDVMTPTELLEAHDAALEARGESIIGRIRNGESLGLALVHEDVPVEARRLLLGHFVSEELADGLDRHYLHDAAGRYEEALHAELAVEEVLAATSRSRRRAQRIGAAALIPFIALLVVHGLNHNVPLFLASFAAFFAALPSILRIPKMRGLALREAAHEYGEYVFLFPLFLSISLLTNAGLFDALQGVITEAADRFGYTPVALGQFLGSSFLSAILDNNVVADFASRGVRGLEMPVLQFFAMAQIFGYALGGCWTHIGCAQSVVAFAFIQRDVDERYTPLQWIRDMTPIVLQTALALAAIILFEGMFL